MNAARAAGIVAVLAILCLLPAQAVQEGPIVAVFDIEERGARLAKDKVQDLTDFLAARLAEGGYQVILLSEIMNRLKEQNKDSFLACYDESCQIELGRELGAQKSLSTQLLKVADKCQVTGVL